MGQSVDESPAIVVYIWMSPKSFTCSEASLWKEGASIMGSGTAGLVLEGGTCFSEAGHDLEG